MSELNLPLNSFLVYKDLSYPETIIIVSVVCVPDNMLLVLHFALIHTIM